VLAAVASIGLQTASAQENPRAQGGEGEPGRMQQWRVPTPAQDTLSMRCCFARRVMGRLHSLFGPPFRGNWRMRSGLVAARSIFTCCPHPGARAIGWLKPKVAFDWPHPISIVR